MSDLKGDLKNSARTPPYISLSTLLTFIEELKANGLPPQIDSSVLKRFSGSVRTQLLTALKYLGLITPDKKPTDELAILVVSFGDEPQFKDALRLVITQSYKFLSALDLKTATPTMFAEAFRQHTGSPEAVLYKCRTFYLQAAKYVGIELGQRLTAGTSGATRTATATKAVPRKRTTKPAKEKGVTSNGNGRHEDDPPKLDDDTLNKLLAKFPTLDPKWDPKITEKWFENFSELMSRMPKK